MPTPHAVRLTVLADNGACEPGLAAGHGLSVLVEASGSAVLFDTGADGSFLRNGALLGVDPAAAPVLVLSHGHWDHAGGVPALLAAGGRPSVFRHGRFRVPRRAVDPGGGVRDVGVPWAEDLLVRAGVAVRTVGEAPLEVAPGVWSTGGIAAREPHPFPENLQCAGCGGAWETDRFPDEQALVVEAGRGVVVVAGCCHAGVGNLLAAVAETAPGRPVLALLGGLHLKGADPGRVRAAAEAVERHRVERLYPNHCTGPDGAAALSALLGDRVHAGCAGAGFRLRAG